MQQNKNVHKSSNECINYILYNVLYIKAWSEVLDF